MKIPKSWWRRPLQVFKPLTRAHFGSDIPFWATITNHIPEDAVMMMLAPYETAKWQNDSSGPRIILLANPGYHDVGTSKTVMLE